jgi:opacity protein-like surface antigen
MKKLIPLLGLFLAATQAQAADMSAKQIYFGAGVGFNSIDYNNNFNNNNDNDAVGFQLFAGLPLAVDLGSAKLAVEVGYMDTGNFDHGGSANGIWSTAVAGYSLNKSIELLGRLGYDFGDDDGLMAGAGVGFALASKIDMRVEYVVRDHIDSLQANLVFHQ